MKIPLTQGFFALVDKRDYEMLSKFSWCVDKRRNGLRYANTTIQKPTPHTIRMHQMIFPDASPEIDHKNRNGLDNRRRNLRQATRAQNGSNYPKIKRGNTSSKYKGVAFQSRLTTRPWQARLGKLHLGYFATEDEAGAVYDRAAQQRYGDYARINGVAVTIRPNYRYRVVSKAFKATPMPGHPEARILEYVLACGHTHSISACKSEKIGTESHCKTCMEAAS